MPLAEGYQADRLLMWLPYLGMGEILSGGQDDLPASPSSTLLLTHISSESPNIKESLTNLIIGHEGWTRR
jgi:hypothetical protein